MRLELTGDSRVFIELRAAGLFRVVGHDPVLGVPAEPGVSFAVPAASAGAFDVALNVRFRVDAIEPPADLSPSDRAQMKANLQGADVLDAARFSVIAFHGRYSGTLDGGRLSGDVVVRGAAKPVSLNVQLDRRKEPWVATGAWEGRLTDLGIKPFKAMMGALKLSDWMRLRVQAFFTANET